MAAAAFEELGVMPELIKAVDELGWTLPTPVQAEAVPLILGGGDVMAAAETGSGKTGAFALPVLQIVHETLQGWARGAAVASASAAAAPDGSGRRCELSVDDRDSFFSIRDGLHCQARQEKSWGGARATLGAFAGKVYYEAEVCDEGLCRVGWATMAASYDIGTDRHSFGFGGTGKKSHNRQFDSYGAEYSKGDTIGCLLDADEGRIGFSRNGELFPTAFELPQYLRGQVLYPAVTLKNAEMRLNFGDAPFRHGPPPGYVGLSRAPPDVTASAAAAAAAAATAGGSGGDRLPLCIVMEPSRDLAEQTHKCFQAYAKHLSAPALSSVLLVGGLDAGPQLKALKAGAEIVVGTPGRLIDFIESGKLPLDKVRFFVLDEADRLMDSEDVVMKIFRRLPKGGAGLARLQVLMFSATLHSPEVKRLAAAICHQPLLVDLKGKDALPEAVDHVMVTVDPCADGSWLQSTPQVHTDNIHALDAIGSGSRSPECLSEGVKRLKQRLLQRLADTHDMSQCLVFCRTNFDCDNLERFLNGLGGGSSGFRGKRESGPEHKYSCVVLAGQRSMDERRLALQAFKDGDVRFLICTDVAARGIDISGLPYVVNMTLPDKAEDYIHRVGRVGRADHMGLAISLVSAVPEKVWFCTVKGFKPWLQPDAQNTKTQEQGGHTIWYNEPQLLKEVEARLSAPIPSLNDDLSLPAHIQARLQGEGGAYGQARGSATSAEATQRLASIQHSVQELASLEWQAQTSFLLLKHKWGQSAAMVEG